MDRVKEGRGTVIRRVQREKVAEEQEDGGERNGEGASRREGEG
jgi:hypothetical protein